MTNSPFLTRKKSLYPKSSSSERTGDRYLSVEVIRTRSPVNFDMKFF